MSVPIYHTQPTECSLRKVKAGKIKSYLSTPNQTLFLLALPQLPVGSGLGGTNTPQYFPFKSLDIESTIG
jgi:hypothetical protein